MSATETVFDRTYAYYLDLLKDVDFESVAPRLGGRMDENGLKIPLYGNEYTVCAQGISGPSGQKPSHDICVLLSRYILMCPASAPQANDWVSFKDLKDAGPLTAYFRNDIEGGLTSLFTGKCDALKSAAHVLGGRPPALTVHYNVSVQFNALPMVPVILLFNDGDAEFAARCSLLFERRAEAYLDPECICMLAGDLLRRLKSVSPGPVISA